ncbi:unnamed protein product [Porites evermanni]|uniref:Uncharacterized protein n=1 Tax=Porites evermanni TaxID=104178 RepID=A0ABN8LQG8_9CNID|nr:unnamed protein product [Porites evermanni]
MFTNYEVLITQWQLLVYEFDALDRSKGIGLLFKRLRRLEQKFDSHGYNELHKAGVYDTLVHKFSTRGHTFLRNDSDFSKIKKGKSSATVYLPSDRCKIVKEANQWNPFQVVQMEQRQFFDYKEHIESKYTNRHTVTFVPPFRDGH